MDLEAFFRVMPEFTQYNESDVRILEQTMTVNEYPDGHVFFKEGSSGKDIYLILDGTISVIHNRGKVFGPLEIKQHTKGEWFGVISLLGNVKHQATCTAIGKVTVASLPQTAFTLLYNSHTHLAHLIQLQITRQLINDHRALLSVIRKVANQVEDINDSESVIRSIQVSYQGPERRKNLSS